MRLVWFGLLLLAVAAGGCLSSDTAPPVEEAHGQGQSGGGPDAGRSFTDPKELTTDGLRGFEPSIEVGPNGTVFVTAHKANRTHEGDRLASWLWYSPDDGETWKELSSPLDLHRKLPAQEGDVAVDGQGRLYFVDTYVADVTVSAWDQAEAEPEWAFSRPAGPVAHSFNDRPWIAASGEGTAYYLAHGAGSRLTGPDRDVAAGSRTILHRSTDGGWTFQPVHGFNVGSAPNLASAFCQLAADPSDASHVAVSCTTHLGAGARVISFDSTDGGETWNRQRLPSIDTPGASPFRSVPAIGANGTVYHAWIEDQIATYADEPDDSPGSLYLARSTEEGFRVTEVPAPDGSLSTHWIAAGRPGHVALLVHAADTLDNGDGAEWYPYVIATDEAQARSPEWTVTRLGDQPVADDREPPADFSQIAIDPADLIHVAYGAEDHPCEVGSGCYESRFADSVYYVRETAQDSSSG